MQLSPPDGRLLLNGRSLVLVPSVFCLDGPYFIVNTCDNASPHMLVYPALRTVVDAVSLWTPEAAPNGRALAMLLGRTRTRALEAIADTCTTTELALRRTDVGTVHLPLMAASLTRWRLGRSHPN